MMFNHRNIKNIFFIYKRYFKNTFGCIQFSYHNLSKQLNFKNKTQNFPIYSITKPKHTIRTLDTHFSEAQSNFF